MNKENWNHLDVGTYYGQDATKHRELKLTESIADNTDGNWRPELMKLVRWNLAGTMDDLSRRHLEFDKRDYANAPANFVDYSTVPEEPSRSSRSSTKVGRATPSACPFSSAKRSTSPFRWMPTATTSSTTMSSSARPPT